MASLENRLSSLVFVSYEAQIIVIVEYPSGQTEAYFVPPAAVFFAGADDGKVLVDTVKSAKKALEA